MITKLDIMANTPKNKNEEKDKKHQGLEPDPETLHTPDPQEHMKGPVSSVMQNIKEEGKKNNKVSQGEADRRREENM
jgi:hypothetical protein